ncbi:cell division protein DedD [Shewanella aestuarii]|uniref:Cell division protein DedD n=1 Tax=Shewanella aestuarii TaxID=1028752 RepID=A0A6G9QI56_9GAMM|nr:cell division protein DedD [Shewanella aestuarii]QIR14152.1 cell division protein DedD [Shewanella aestuarii]
MERQFKNRLVGTIVFVALGVIFLPDLLDGKKARVVEEFTDIPLRPNNQHQTLATQSSTDEIPEQFEVLDIASVDLGVVSDVEMSQPISTAPEEDHEPIAKNAANNQPVNTVAKTEQIVKAKGSSVVPEKSVTKPILPTKAPVTAGYTLQLGGFNNAKNVSALVAQLRLSGYTAYTLPETPVDGKLTRVFVGPEVSQAKLASRQDAIKKLTGLQGKIVPFNPMDK